VVDVSIRHAEPDDAEAIHRILSSPLASAGTLRLPLQSVEGIRALFFSETREELYHLPRHPQPLARLKFSQVSQKSPRYISHFDVSKTSHEPLMPISLA
jgi:hypothetical protein